jgi:ribonuclease HI
MKTDIFCDGSARGNGQKGARAGYGVAVLLDGYIFKKISVKLPAEEPQTNQRAELQAFFHAFRIVNERQSPATIYTDSMYSINCITVWATGWKKKGWKKADGKPVLHLDIIEPMVALYEEIKPLLEIKHVKGHQTGNSYEAQGNNLADELATQAADS